MNQEASGISSRQEIGQKLKADYIINLEINTLSFYEKGSFNQLYRGNAEISVTCIDVTKPRNEGTVYRTICTCKYPSDARGPLDAGGVSLGWFNTQFMGVMSQQIAHYFVAYPPDANRRME